MSQTQDISPHRLRFDTRVFIWDALDERRNVYREVWACIEAQNFGELGFSARQFYYPQNVTLLIRYDPDILRYNNLTAQVPLPEIRLANGNQSYANYSVETKEVIGRGRYLRLVCKR